jgi:Carboxypeptidase regulatory-like domain/TonB-dependent Receptor Plug Domain
MNRKIDRLTVLAAACMLVFSLASAASAQVFTGRIDMTVEDSTGGRLPGVTVDITGPVNLSQVTDAQGETHFLNLSVGTYTVKASLSGFNSYQNASVEVGVGASTGLSVKLGVSGTTETVFVTAATPLVDTRREATTTNVTFEELQGIPTARDPWVIMQSVPTIVVDRVNVGGAGSGQQSVFMGKGNGVLDNTFSIDGVPITDMVATGSSAAYFDFDMVQEMSVTTGGADSSTMTPGVQLNMVLKKGTNIYHGDARYYFENTGLESNNISPALATSLGSPNGLGNRINQYTDDGFDIGGPIIKDKLFAWGTAARTDIQNYNLINVFDKTTFDNYALKLDYQASSATRLNFTYFEDNKIKLGRNAGGFAPTLLAAATENQNGPTRYYKGEGDFAVGQRLFASARYAYTQAGFTFVPEGGTAANILVNSAGVQSGSNFSFTSDRPQYYAGADASYFAGKQEIKFGFSYRRTPVTSLTSYPGNQILTTQLSSSQGAAGYGGFPFLSPTINGSPCGGCNATAEVLRNAPTAALGQYSNLFVTDTISLNRLTVTAGVRYDHQTSSLTSASVPGVPGFTSILPAITVSPVSNVFDFNAVEPRVGATFALDDSRKTVVRANYAVFASQLPAAAATFVSPGAYSQVTYAANVQNSTGAALASEVNTNYVLSHNGVNFSNPNAPLAATNGNLVNASDPRTQELQFGVDRELMPSLVVGATFTYRRFTNLIWDVPQGITSADYQQAGTLTGTLPTGQAYSVPYYALSAAAGAAWNGLWTATNRPDYYQTYKGFELTVTKRMANHWMGRLGFGTNSWREYFSNRATSIIDPTPTAYQQVSGLQWQLPVPYQTGPGVNGGSMVLYDDSSGESNVYIVPVTYQLSANGLYQAPWGLSFAANVIFRQGFGQPYFFGNTQTTDVIQGQKNVLLSSNVDNNRLPNVTTLDGRVEKSITFGRYKAALDFDVFNLLNSGVTLANQYNASFSTFGQTLEIINPRIARVGLRFMF